MNLNDHQRALLQSRFKTKAALWSYMATNLVSPLLSSTLISPCRDTSCPPRSTVPSASSRTSWRGRRTSCTRTSSSRSTTPDGQSSPTSGSGTRRSRTPISCSTFPPPGPSPRVAETQKRTTSGRSPACSSPSGSWTTSTGSGVSASSTSWTTWPSSLQTPSSTPRG